MSEEEINHQHNDVVGEILVGLRCCRFLCRRVVVGPFYEMSAEFFRKLIPEINSPRKSAILNISNNTVYLLQLKKRILAV